MSRHVGREVKVARKRYDTHGRWVNGDIRTINNANKESRVHHTAFSPQTHSYEAPLFRFSSTERLVHKCFLLSRLLRTYSERLLSNVKDSGSVGGDGGRRNRPPPYVLSLRKKPGTRDGKRPQKARTLTHFMHVFCF